MFLGEQPSPQSRPSSSHAGALERHSSQGTPALREDEPGRVCRRPGVGGAKGVPVPAEGRKCRGRASPAGCARAHRSGRRTRRVCHCWGLSWWGRLCYRVGRAPGRGQSAGVGAERALRGAGARSEDPVDLAGWGRRGLGWGRDDRAPRRESRGRRVGSEEGRGGPEAWRTWE